MGYQNTVIDLLRHGEPEGGRMYRGSGTDHPLSTLGWQQMESAIADRNKLVTTTDWAQIITSPMQRCLAFAEALSQKNKTHLEVIENFTEAGYGEWEGKTPQQVKHKYGKKYWGFYADPVGNRPVGAESLEMFNQRINTSLIDVLDRYKGQRVLLISHAGVMRAIMGITLKMPLASQQQINIPYAGMYSLMDERRGRRVCL